TLEACFLSINLISSSVIMVAVGILTSYHVYCITTNTTTIEGWEKGRSLTIKGMGKIQNVKCPYDQGIYKNLQSVLGQWPIFWFLPGPMSGTGLDFPISTKYMSDGLDDEEKEGQTDDSRRSSVAPPPPPANERSSSFQRYTFPNITPPSVVQSQRRSSQQNQQQRQYLNDHPGLVTPVKPVYKLNCRHCSTTVCARGMKAILLADTTIELYSTDTPSQSIHVLEKDYLTRSCHCRIRDVACLEW
ncbi:FAM72 protein-domain-containing protein, partial [Mucor mucedo]|uniref:FAM72 protein-domain-containing protein n=1 Tax=Mucor mucedo TaxID=29922 RepID=UPI00221E81E3